MFHVFVVDDQMLILEAIRLLCERNSDLRFHGGASSVPEAIKALNGPPADVVVVDMELPSSLEFVRSTRDRWPGAGILAVHDGAPPELLRQAVGLGAMGVVAKAAEVGELLGALRRAASGGPRTLGGRGTDGGGWSSVEEAPRTPGLLSPRELEVLRALALGRSNREIASDLGISPRTVASHVGTIYRRLQVHTRIDAATAAIRLGIASRAGADSHVGLRSDGT
jgi:DNA-binding NarL/FixJ family response regulator